jgi:prepilin-type N-terminal cleavage/methylation domain-containing protein
MKRSDSDLPRSDPRAGFTLIEVLAALFVMGLFMSFAMPYFVRLVERGWTGESEMTMSDQWMGMTTRLTSDLGEAVPMLLDASGSSRPAFTATSQQVVFVHRSLTGSREALETVTLAIHSDAKGSSLTRSVRPFNKNDFGDNVRTQEVALLTTPYRLRFTTIEAKQQQSNDDSSPSTLPDAIALQVQDKNYRPDVPFVFPIAARYPAHLIVQAVK